ncbi:MAG: CHASE3 domain-containing protein, partial [Rubrivivax sp.]|nr:CHASE3 domain-containing protein [Rubrivivax sp.]
AESAQQALTRLAELRSSTAAAEASQRGHAITGDPALLEPLAQAAPRAVALLEELRALSSGDPAQYSRLIALAPLLAQRIEQLAAAADLRHRGTAAGTTAAVAAVDNRRLQEQIQRALTGLQTHADAHLLSARAQAAAAAAWTSRLTLLATLLSLAIAIGALVQNQRAKAQVQRLRRERRQQHEGRARVLQAHASLMESSLAPIAFLDREGRIQSINPAFEKLLGQPKASLTGTPMVQHLLPDDLRKTERALDAAATAPQTLAHRWRRADGSLLHLRWSAQLAHDDGTLVCVAQDDTEARTLAATLAQQQESLQLGAQGLADATERKAGAERSLNEFLATLSRCLRAPLSALLQQTANGQQGVHGAQDAAVARA